MNASTSRPGIVVGTDGSPSACAAITWAAAEAAGTHRSLHLVHAQDPWPVGGYGIGGYPPAEIDEEVRKQGHTVLEAGRAIALADHPQLTVTTELVHGPIIAVLREAAPDGWELVLGHRGAGRFTELLLGSVALRVAGHTRSPVVVVRGDAASAHGEILVGADPDEPMDGPLEYAFDIARRRSASVRVLHGWNVSDDFVNAIRTARGDTDSKTRLSALLAPWRERYPEVKLVEQVVDDHPVAALAEASAAADLLVVGSHGRGGVGAALLGSVVHGVLHHARCPVAVVTSR